MKNNKQQTAVEWLWEIAYNRELTVEDWKQAKEMEKERMIGFAQSYAVIHCMGDITKDAEQYYNETYGGGER